MPDRRLFNLLLALLLLAALAVRLPNLSRRPMHTDEAVHAVKTAELLQGQAFQYDPRDFHGPTLYYSAWLNARLHGVDQLSALRENHLRLVTVIYGSMLLLWLMALFNYWHPLALITSAALFVISPPLVYYSKYYIMETLLLFFHLGFTVALMRYLIKPSTLWMVTGSVCLGLMLATKETALLFAVAAALAIGAAIATAPRPRQTLARLQATIPLRHLIVSVLIVTAVFATLISGFGANLGNIGAYLGSFGSYLQRGFVDQVHVQPWYYYGKMLLFSRWGEGPVWSEILTLLLAAAGAFGLLKDRRTGQASQQLPNHFLLWSTIITFIALSLIPYKTPWNILVIMGGLILLAGHGLVRLFQSATSTRQKVALAGMLLLGVGHLGWQSTAATGKYEASPLNPYVYAHTSPELQILTRRLHQIAQSDPRGYALPIQVVATGHDYWPLPWDLRKFSRVTWWDSIDTTATPADIIVLRTTQTNHDSLATEIEHFIYSGFPPGQKHLFSYLFDHSISLRPGIELSTLVKYYLLEQSRADTLR